MIITMIWLIPYLIVTCGHPFRVTSKNDTIIIKGYVDLALEGAANSHF